MKAIADRAQVIVQLYTRQHLSSPQIALRFHCSRSYIIRILRKHGVDTTSGVGTQVLCTCSFCGVEFSTQRSRWRKNKNHFCSDEHYYASRKNTAYLQNRNGQRIARTVVARFFPLKKHHVVHHVDGNNLNNNRSNLWVFSSHSTHIAFHHKSNVSPLWKG